MMDLWPTFTKRPSQSRSYLHAPLFYVSIMMQMNVPYLKKRIPGIFNLNVQGSKVREKRRRRRRRTREWLKRHEGNFVKGRTVFCSPVTLALPREECSRAPKSIS